MQDYKIFLRDIDKDQSKLAFINEDLVNQVQKFHQSFDEYQETPLLELKNLAKLLGLKNIFIKDESYRFGLNAFKVLGGSFAIGRYIADLLGIDLADLTQEKMLSKEVKDKLGDVTFVSATDGNHGRGVAWAAQQLGQKCSIFMPDGSSIQRRDAIRSHGAECEIMEGLNYDDCVRLANKNAEEKGWILVQDTAWEGYEKIPTWILQGYATLAKEAKEQIEAAGQRPSHIFVQAGVGSFATAITGYYASAYKDDQPMINVVEPATVNCLYKTAKAEDGKIHKVTGKLETIMAGLACGEPVTIGWPVLDSFVQGFISAPDSAAARGMRILGNPLGNDKRVISGESGAVSLGVLADLCQRKDLVEWKEKLSLDENSVILLFSTEGDTDFEHYRKIVWDGLYKNEGSYIYNSKY